MDNTIDRMGYRSHFLHQGVATPKNLQNKKQGFSQFYPLALYCEKWQKFISISLLFCPSVIRGPWLSANAKNSAKEFQIRSISGGRFAIMG